jgi:opacity protein-like surface antigen
MKASAVVRSKWSWGLSALLSLPAFAQDAGQSVESPRWSYEIRAGYLEPDLDRFDTFYGDDRETLYALGASVRIKDWLEVGTEYGHMRARGVGVSASTGEPAGSVRYRLNPLQIYSNLIFHRQALQRAVPYLGLGLVTARYDQSVELQSDSEGTTDLGHSIRLGVRIRVGSNRSSRGTAQSRDPFWRSYMLIEASDMSTKAEGIELGGQSYLLGFRMEFDFR